MQISYNSLENPIGIETITLVRSMLIPCSCYNSLENPIGIETYVMRVAVRLRSNCYNSLENPIGIETGKTFLLRSFWISLQLIRKPDRD